MKKIFVIFIVVLIMITSQLSIFALEFSLGGEWETPPFRHIFNIDGESYVGFYTADGDSIPYSEREYKFFVEEKGGTYIWTGEYYYVRGVGGDMAPGRYQINASGPVQLYDADLNLVKEYLFGIYAYPRDISYYENTYYCFINTTGRSRWMASDDFENWTEVEGPVPRSNGMIAYKSSQWHIDADITAVTLNGNEFYPVCYEGEESSLYRRQFGKWLMKKDEQQNIYLSNDNVYFVKIGCPDELKRHSNFTIDTTTLYEHDSLLVVEGTWQEYREKVSVSLTILAQPIYDELERMKNPIYVNMNGNILGFQEIPVIEDDRTLVPMRFLFEQMGEKVEWEGETQTATVIDANSRIAFSIDNNTAEVNGSFKTMDVPARLINGKTMVPLRFLSEELGYTVEWDEQNNIATIRTK